MYSINATIVTSCSKTKVRDLDVIVPRPYTQINAKRISTTRMYFAFYRGRNSTQRFDDREAELDEFKVEEISEATYR